MLCSKDPIGANRYKLFTGMDAGTASRIQVRFIPGAEGEGQPKSGFSRRRKTTAETMLKERLHTLERSSDCVNEGRLLRGERSTRT